MKFILKLSLLFLGFSAVSSAASISLANFDGTSDPVILNPIINSGGVALTTGIVVVGTFTAEPTAPSDVLGATFVRAGSGSLGFLGSGYFQGTINTPTLTAGDAFVGNSVYVVLGNGTTLLNSTEFAVWKAITNSAGNLFTADNPTGGPSSVTVFNSVGNVLVGSKVPSFNSGGTGLLPAIQLAPLAAIPEPSALLLSALGALALLRRKR